MQYTCGRGCAACRPLASWGVLLGDGGSVAGRALVEIGWLKKLERKAAVIRIFIH